MSKKYIVTVNGARYEVAVEEADPNTKYTPAAAATAAAAPAAAPVAPVAPAAAAPAASAAPAKNNTSVNGVKMTSPLPGTVLKIFVAVGDTVKKGTLLCKIEAMKMENEFQASADGTIASVNVSEGASVNAGDLLFVIS